MGARLGQNILLLPIRHLYRTKPSGNMLTRAQKGAVREFYASIQELDRDLITLLRNLTILHEYILRNIVHEPLVEPFAPIPNTNKSPLTSQVGNAHSLIDSFGRLDLCVSQLSSYITNKDIPTRTHFAIRCAKGGLAANDKLWAGVLARNLLTALETWGTLRKELGTSMASDSDGLWRCMEENLTSYIFSLVEKHQAMGHVLRPGYEAEVGLET